MRTPKFTISALFVALAALSSTACKKNVEQPSPPAQAKHEPQQSQHPATPASGGDMLQQMRASCPMVVQGAQVAAADIEGGAALSFTTDQGDVSDLRAHVQHMAQMYDMHHGGSLMWHHMAGGQMGHGAPGTGSGQMGHGGPGMGASHMGPSGPMPDVTATVTNVDKGARLELKPKDPAQLTALREHAREHQQRMQSGQCWMSQPAAPAPEN